MAPMSGHYATLLRGTVEAFLPKHDVYITDWVDARMVPLSDGSFDLDDYIDYVISILHYLGGDAHIIAVCQPSVPVLAAVSVMEARNDAYAPNSMILMGGPIDTRVNPTAVNTLAEKRGLDWFRRHVITQVPFPNRRHDARRLSGLPATQRLHGNESRSPSRRAPRCSCTSCAATAIRRRSIGSSTTSTWPPILRRSSICRRSRRCSSIMPSPEG